MRFVNLLIKPASSLCNLRCKYCFYEDEARNRTQHSMGIMQDALAEVLIRQVFEAVDQNGSVSFAFQGGEPTIAGLPFFRFFVATVLKYRPGNVRVSYAIQTNGTLLNEQWACFLEENHFLVGLSLDGIRPVHEMYRIDAMGGGTWKQVLAARTLLKKHGVAYNALCVVTGPCTQRAEAVYKSLKNLGFRYMQFIACLDPIGCVRGQKSWSLTPEAYGKFLCRIFDLWYQDWETSDYHSVRLFDDYVHILLGDGASTCATCGKCGEYLVVESDGSAYPCDFYVLDNWRIGNLEKMPITEMLSSEKANAFLTWNAHKPAECAYCRYDFICNCGCKKDWFTDETGSHNYFCNAFRSLLDHALPRLKRVARAERTARQCR